MPREFECEREVVLPSSIEEAWEAVATAAGNNAWLFPNEIAPDGSGTEAWDPPARFAVRTQQGDWFNALSFELAAKDGSRTTLRYCHSGIFTEDWDTQYDAVQQHTDFYLHTLGEYLAHFSGRRATYIGGGPGGLQGPPASAGPDGFRRLQDALGLAPAEGEGDAVSLTPRGAGETRRGDRLQAAELLRPAHQRRPVSLLRTQRIRVTRGHEHPPLRRGRRRGRRDAGMGALARDELA